MAKKKPLRGHTEVSLACGVARSLFTKKHI